MCDYIKTDYELSSADDEIVGYYKNKNNWNIQEIRDFENRVMKLYNENYDYFENIQGFNDDGYDGYSIETRNCDSWGGLDSTIEKTFKLDLDDLAKDSECNFLYTLDDEQLIFNRDKLKAYFEKRGLICKI